MRHPMSVFLARRRLGMASRRHAYERRGTRKATANKPPASAEFCKTPLIQPDAGGSVHFPPAARTMYLSDRRWLAGQQESLLRPLRKLAVIIRLADQPGAHRQSGPVQQPGDLLRPAPVEVERDRVPHRLRHVQWLVANLEAQQHESARPKPPAELGEG